MLTNSEIERIEELLKRGATPQEVANAFGISLSGFRHKLRDSFKEIKIERKLVDIVPPAFRDREREEVMA